MMKFTASAVDDEAWPLVCNRNFTQRAIDGDGCTEDAYTNLTRFIEPSIDTITDL